MITEMKLANLKESSRHNLWLDQIGVLKASFDAVLWEDQETKKTRTTFELTLFRTVGQQTNIFTKASLRIKPHSRPTDKTKYTLLEHHPAYYRAFDLDPNLYLTLLRPSRGRKLAPEAPAAPPGPPSPEPAPEPAPAALAAPQGPPSPS